MTGNEKLSTQSLLALAEGRMPEAQRRALVARAARDPALAQEIKMALRLADASAEFSCNWVATAARAPVPARSTWWRPALALAAGLGVVVVLTQSPRELRESNGSANEHSIATKVDERPDHLSAPSFESSTLFGGSFEAGNG